MNGYIYKITCTKTNLCYVGQTQKDLSNRMKHHIYNSKNKESPLAKAINEHGEQNFTIEVIERADLNRLDEIEAKWIKQLNTVSPNGYNVYSHGRYRN
jgi:group I intron endonuclease